MKYKLNTIIFTGLFLIILTGFSFSEENETENKDEKIFNAGEVQVSAKGKKKDLDNNTPSKTIINTDKYTSPGNAQNITDILKDLPMIDFKGETSLIPDDDTIYLRGFGATRFVTALDGITLRKTGGRKSSHIVDYALLPIWMIETIEVLPGPHSAIYPAKSIGGVLNVITRTPKEYLTYEPEINVTNSYSSYNTHHHNINMHGGFGAFIYDFGYEKYSTDGYLRNTEADIDTLFGRFGYLFNSGGYITLSMSYADADRETTVENDPSLADYDSEYPTVIDKTGTSLFSIAEDPTWDKIAQSYRINLKKTSNYGLITAVARYSEENRDRYVVNDPDNSWDTKWRELSAKVQDEIKLSDTQTLTIGTEIEQCYDGYGTTNWTYSYDDKKRIEILSGYAQHKWNINPEFKVTTGLRYEDVTIQVGNINSSGNYMITGQPEWIERNFDGILPKIFLTWDTGSFLKDSSLSVGVSRIWRAPDYHGDYNPQGKPAGAFLDPEHGIGYDLIFSKKLMKKLNFKFNYSYYEIKDFIMYQGKKYSEHMPGAVAGEEWSDWKINLEKVTRHGIDTQLNGNLTDSISFYLGYAYQKLESLGDEPAGKEGVDDRPEHKFKMGLKYNVLKNTLLILDYEFESDQVIVTYDKTDDTYSETELDSYQVVNFAVQQTLIKKGKYFNDLLLKLFINNLLDEEYMNVDGFPATDRTFGATLKYSF